MSNNTYILTNSTSFLSNFKAVTKMGLSLSVVFSSIAGYLLAAESIHLFTLFLLAIGGYFMVGASNVFNQIIERDLDALMDRTKNRPIPTGRMSVSYAFVLAVILTITGLIILYTINERTAMFGAISICLYTSAYTPLKTKTPLSVFVGAIPGALPPMIGAVAVTGEFGLIPGVLFFVQFVWQFPHFWAIAWVSFDDYKAGGFSLLPSKTGKSKNSAFQIVVYSLALIPFSLLPWMLEITGIVSFVIALILGLWFFFLSWKLFMTCDDKDARKLMFASFIYLPIIQFVYVFDANTEMIKSLLAL
jgi:protoheme IX farnesyltransferase